MDGIDDGDDDLEDMAPADRILHLQRTVSRLTKERDALSSSLTEIQSLRSTTAESTLASYKKATEAKLKHSAELASSLRARLRAAGGTGAEEDKAEDDAMERLREELEREKRHRREAQEKGEWVRRDGPGDAHPLISFSRIQSSVSNTTCNARPRPHQQPAAPPRP